MKGKCAIGSYEPLRGKGQNDEINNVYKGGNARKPGEGMKLMGNILSQESSPEQPEVRLLSKAGVSNAESNRETTKGIW